MSHRMKPATKPRLVGRSDTVCVAFIHPGETSAYFTTSIIASLLYDAGTAQHITGLLNEWSSANVSQSRNSLTEQFLEHNQSEWLLWIDADMGWDHDAIPRLLASADPVKAPIVGALCFGARHGELFPTIYQMAQTEHGDLTTMRPHDYPPDAMVGCAATGAAFLLIHRSVLVAMRDRKFSAAFPWFQETELAGKPAGEDLTFCLRAGQCGFPVYVNTGVRISHHKSHLLTADLHAEQRAKEAACTTSETSSRSPSRTSTVVAIQSQAQSH
jgi:hypothetical protein